MAENISKKIYIRKENIYPEARVPIVPDHIIKLIDIGFIVFIEASDKRIYNDNSYKRCGAIITTKPWYDDDFKDFLIIGLKELKDLDKLDWHKHIYFSHSYKGQSGSDIILNHFSKSNSIIYDFEYILDDNNKRLISFGYYAGIVGGLLGIIQHYHKLILKKDIEQLSFQNSIQEIIDNIYILNTVKQPDITIIGGNGMCGSGVRYVLEEMNLEYKIIDSTIENYKEIILRSDIFFNCIKLNEDYNEVWFDENTEFYKPMIICDISCDYMKPNNPIKIYNKRTTWEKPIYNYNNFVNIIAIDNLPSFLPQESSEYFSEKLVALLEEYANGDKSGIWRRAELEFNKRII
jgi:saccharopine dehydrogenase (NAD+, L-lysine-forming)